MQRPSRVRASLTRRSWVAPCARIDPWTRFASRTATPHRTRTSARTWIERRTVLVFALVLGIALGTACETTTQDRGPANTTNLARVDVFLGCGEPNARSLALDVESVELRGETGDPVVLVLSRPRLVPSELARRAPLAGGSVPPGNYTSIVVNVRRATLASAEGDVELRLVGRDAPPTIEPPTPGAPLACELPLRARLGRQDALSVFVDWDVAASLPGGAECAPAFALTTERAHASLGMLYVADGASGAVSAVERSSGEVVATYKCGAEPCALALSRDRRHLFAVNARDGSLDLVDLYQRQTVSTLTFGLSARSSDVALLDSRGRLAVAQRDLDKVSIVDVSSFSRVIDVAVGRSPVRLVAVPNSERVFVVESGVDSVSLVDLSAQAVVGSVGVESRPSDAAVDRRGRELFVGHTISPNLLVFDASTLAPRATIYVGSDVTAVACDRRRDRIYVARSRPPEIVVVDRELRSVLRRIRVSGRIESLAQPLDGAELYGAAPESGALVVVDLVLGKELPPIHLGGRPLDVVVGD